MKRHKLAGLPGCLLLLAAFAFMLPGASATPDFEVVTSVPAETTISRAGTRDAAAVWLEMINGARRSLDIAEFYLASEKGEALEPVIDAVLAAGRRGVQRAHPERRGHGRHLPGYPRPLPGAGRTS